MKTWTIRVNGEVVWFGTDTLTPNDETLKSYIAAKYDNILPLAYPGSKVYNHKDYLDRVRASLLFAKDLFGQPEIETEGFSLDDLIIEEEVPEGAIF